MYNKVEYDDIIEEAGIMEYAEDKTQPRKTCYGYVPVDTVYLLLTKHGGVVSGEVPKGVPVYGEQFPRQNK